MLKELSHRDYQTVWDGFKQQFMFQPSTNPRKWPGIDEPIPSLTISLTESKTGARPTQEEIIAFFRGAFNQLPANARIKYIMDWCHRCYYAPEVFEGYLWVYPDEDYAICLSEDLKTGTFGHPWEQSICVFGDALLAIVKQQLPLSTLKAFRESA